MRLLRYCFMSLVILFMLAPILVVMGVSVNEQKRLLFPPQGLSFQWYGELFTQADWFSSLYNSVLIALCASILAVSIALPIALYLWHRNSAFAKLLYSIGLAPFMLPPVITALGLLIFWVTVGGSGHITATIISHGVFLVTLPLVTISLGLGSINRQLVEAAQTLGADSRTVFFTILRPLVTPYVVSGFAFAFVLSLNEYIIAYMVAGFTVETLPIKIFNSLRYGYTPIMAAVAVIFVLVSVVIFGGIARFGDLPRLLGAQPKDVQ